jgi:hypothetical protein
MQKIVGQDDEAARNLSVRLARKLFTQVPRRRGVDSSSERIAPLSKSLFGKGEG